MLCRNFTSDYLQYTLGGPDGGYNPSIPAPYNETLSGLVLGLFFQPQTTTTGRIVFSAWVGRRAWPGFSANLWLFDSDTGAFIEERDSGAGGGGGFIGSSEISQGANDELYGQTLLYAGIYRLTPDTYQATSDPPILPGDFGASNIFHYTIDLVRDMMVMRSSNEGLYQLGVYKLSDGTLLRRVELPDTLADVCHGGGTHVYLLLNNKMLMSLDYTTGQIFQCTRIPSIVDPANAKIAYDRRYQRLLVCEATPDNPDGSSTVRIYGYRNRPVGVHVCKPIPLKRMRAGATTPVLHKLIGDAGEGIVGLMSSVATNVNAQVVRTLTALDGDGEAVIDVLGLAEGADTITASVEVECLL